MRCPLQQRMGPFQAGLFLQHAAGLLLESNVFTTHPPENRRAEGWSPAPSVETQQKLLGWAMNVELLPLSKILRKGTIPRNLAHSHN